MTYRHSGALERKSSHRRL